MTPELGTALVHAALFFAALGSGLGFWAGAGRHRRAATWARAAGIGFAVAILAANALMVTALLQHDFSVKYVAEVGSRATPVYFTVVSLWASLNGSILFWGGILGLYTLVFLVVNRGAHRAYMPWTIGVMLANAVFFTLLVSGVANPFERISPVPPDGPGPNPLLQNHWLMAVHPPTLYLGYVGMVLPFSMIAAALFAGRLDAGWMAPIRRWMLVPWAFLSVGIVLGGWWSYGVLGWGGPWAWDPVENASFLPWLTGTAFLHSAMVMQRKGELRVWTLVLGMATFVLTLVGTFMTRSGVFNSVHSFTQSPIGPVFLWFIAIVLTFSVLLLALREHTLVQDVDDPGARGSLMARVLGVRMHPISREFSILLQNGVFTVFTFTVLLGTLYPLIAEEYDGRRVSVGEPYFDRWALPLGLAIVFLMGVGPALPWGRMAPRRLLNRLVGPTTSGLVLTAAMAVLGFAGPLVSLTFFVCGFAFVANLGELVTPVLHRRRSKGEGALTATWAVLRRSRRRYGGHLAHHGILLAVMSLALYKGFKEEVDVTLARGESAGLAGHVVTFAEVAVDDQPHRRSVLARFDVSKDGALVAKLAPRLNYYPTQREPVFTPDVLSTVSRDVYLSLVEIDPGGSYVVVRLITVPGILWLWVAPVLIALGTLIAVWPPLRPTALAAPPDGEPA